MRDTLRHPAGAQTGLDNVWSKFQPWRKSMLNVDEIPAIPPTRDSSLVALDDALEAFSKVAPRQAKLVDLRYFGGLSEDEIAELLEISPRTVRRDWDFAKSWLMRELSR